MTLLKLAIICFILGVLCMLWGMFIFTVQPQEQPLCVSTRLVVIDGERILPVFECK